MGFLSTWIYDEINVYAKVHEEILEYPNPYRTGSFFISFNEAKLFKCER